ncbi:STAS domain-containing protein [Lachnoclostridium sp. MSJ-17]|uniref:STAS domain-containing protein n=1 Tax=Lachnoclostridium sp. MSJ-17 TaxID=2841516 RepID=UPI001C128CCA|nr:STAS domain-containing protein [Lachnoclostridium sp. MSJ-17]MBU5462017.1 STAS domain-containing protein [Lachnoclostridium sp. MSJ-17]
MNITKQSDSGKLTLFLDGKLDTVTAPQLDAELKSAFEEYDTVEINLEKLAYISSAGLRVLHSNHKRVKGKKTMLISHANGTVLDIFESTSFSSFLNLI